MDNERRAEKASLESPAQIRDTDDDEEPAKRISIVVNNLVASPKPKLDVETQSSQQLKSNDNNLSMNIDHQKHRRDTTETSGDDAPGEEGTVGQAKQSRAKQSKEKQNK